MSQPAREQWSSRLGFVLAAVGSAVGLGNMWRFSYLTAENGGAAFVLLYVIFTLLIGLPVLLAELTIGRGSRRSPVQALVHFGGTRWRPLGALFVVSGFLILAYYSVIAGWTLRYTVEALLVGMPADANAHFGEISTGGPAIAWHLLFMTLTTVIVAGGVRAGIERAAVVLMPLLFVQVIGLAVYASTLDGSTAGYRFYLEIDLDKLGNPDVLREAAGQAFFSLSLGMGAMLTYASYLSRQEHLPDESVIVAVADFGVAFVAGLAVFPLIFALGLQDDVAESTVGALFITLPHAFHELGVTGRIVGFVFFAALIVGALTSALSLLEVVVASAMDSFGWPRATAAVWLGGAIAVLGLPAAIDLRVLGWMDALAGNLFLVFGGLMLSVFVGWRMSGAMEEVSAGAEGVRWFVLWQWLLRIPVPAVLAYVLFRGLLALGEG